MQNPIDSSNNGRQEKGNLHISLRALALPSTTYVRFFYVPLNKWKEYNGEWLTVRWE